MRIEVHYIQCDVCGLQFAEAGDMPVVMAVSTKAGLLWSIELCNDCLEAITLAKNALADTKKWETIRL